MGSQDNGDESVRSPLQGLFDWWSTDVPARYKLLLAVIVSAVGLITAVYAFIGLPTILDYFQSDTPIATEAQVSEVSAEIAELRTIIDSFLQNPGATLTAEQIDDLVDKLDDVSVKVDSLPSDSSEEIQQMRVDLDEFGAALSELAAAQEVESYSTVSSGETQADASGNETLPPTGTPMHTQEPDKFYTTTNATVVLREGPHENFQVSKVLPQGSKVLVLARNQDRTWYLVQSEADEVIGWVDASTLVEASGAPGGIKLAATIPVLPTSTFTVTPTKSTSTSTPIPSATPVPPTFTLVPPTNTKPPPTNTPIPPPPLDAISNFIVAAQIPQNRTGISVEPNDLVRIEYLPGGMWTAEKYKSTGAEFYDGCGYRWSDPEPSHTWIFPEDHRGAVLVGYIGNINWGNPDDSSFQHFVIGCNSVEIPARIAGELSLGMSDCQNCYWDNEGNMTANISVTRR